MIILEKIINFFGRKNNRSPIKVSKVSFDKSAVGSGLEFVLEVSRFPEFRYSKVPQNFLADKTPLKTPKRLLVSKDFPFISAYSCDDVSDCTAFGGRVFDIPLADGTVETAKGQWWDNGTEDAAKVLGFPGGVTSVKITLKKQHLFSSVVSEARVVNIPKICLLEILSRGFKYE